MASEMGYLEDRHDCTTRICIEVGAPQVGAMSKEDGRRERGSWGGTIAADTEAMSLRAKKKGKKDRIK